MTAHHERKIVRRRKRPLQPHRGPTACSPCRLSNRSRRRSLPPEVPLHPTLEGGLDDIIAFCNYCRPCFLRMLPPTGRQDPAMRRPSSMLCCRSTTAWRCAYAGARGVGCVHRVFISLVRFFEYLPCHYTIVAFLWVHLRPRVRVFIGVAVSASI